MRPARRRRSPPGRTPIALGRGVDADEPGTTALRIVAVAGAAAIFGALGAAIGVLVPHPAISVGAIVGWQLVEQVAGFALGINEFLPIGAFIALAHLGDTVNPILAASLLFAYALGGGLLALEVANRRDLT